MKEATPNYYSKFHCIAEKCKHNCCIGWEIDIDEKTLDFYNSLTTPLGERIRQNICTEEPHFILDEHERCPFLNNNGLCNIICECGEGGLCDICHLHPRFRNFYSDFIETGLGFCCEEAARIVLTSQEKFEISIPEEANLTTQEKEHFEIRNTVFGVLQNRNMSIKQRFCKLAEMFGLEFDFSLCHLYDTYISLERLDEAWTNQLQNIKDFAFDGSIFENPKFTNVFEQLSVYFIFRHFADALIYVDYCERVNFTLKSCYIIGALLAFNIETMTDEKMIDMVRMYSSEIEYSEENTWALMEV